MSNYLKNFSVSALAIIFLAIFTAINPNTGFDILAFLLILFIILQKIFGEYFILILLAMRPALDYWRDFNLFSFQFINFNTNAAISIFLLIWSIIFFAKNFSYFKQLPLKIPWFIFIAWCALSAIYTYDLASTITETMKLANLFALFGICYIMARKDGPIFKKYFLKAALAGAVIPLLLGIYQFITKTGMDIDDISNRIYGTFAHPNVLATFALVLLMLLVNEIITKNTKIFSSLTQESKQVYSPLARLENKSQTFFDYKTDTAAKFLGLFLLIIIALTYTRIAWIGAAVLFIIIGAIYYQKALFGLLGATILFYALFYPLNNYLINNYNINLQASGLILRLTSRNEDSDSVRWRADLITKVFPLFKKKYILGYGYGTFARVWDDNKDIENLWDNTSEAHNDYIKVAFEAGIIGLFFFLTIFASLLYKQMSFAVKNNWNNLVFIASIIIYLILSLSDNILHHTPMIWWLWAAWGVWTSEFKVESKKL